MRNGPAVLCLNSQRLALICMISRKNINDLIADLKINNSLKIKGEAIKQSTPEQELRRRATVYFHFSGLDHARATAITNELAKSGWHIP